MGVYVAFRRCFIVKNEKFIIISLFYDYYNNRSTIEVSESKIFSQTSFS